MNPPPIPLQPQLSKLPLFLHRPLGMMVLTWGWIKAQWGFVMEKMVIEEVIKEVTASKKKQQNPEN